MTFEKFCVIFLSRKNYKPNFIIIMKKFFEKIRVKKDAKRRDHQLSASDERLLLKCGSDNLIRFYIHKFSFREEVEKEIFKLCSQSVTRSYISRYPFGDDLECKVLDDERWSGFYIKAHGLKTKAQRELLKKENSPLCRFFIEQGWKFAEELEAEFLQSAPEDLIELYFDKHSPSPEAFRILIRKNPKYLIKYAKNARIPEEFEADFINTASDEEFSAYIEGNIFHLEGCLVLLEGKNRERLRKYISNHSLTAEEKLFQLGDEELIGEYIYSHFDEISENGELELFASKNVSLIKRYIDLSSGCFDSVEEEILKGDNDEIFEYYTERCNISEENQLVLVRSGKKERIEAYIQNNQLCPEAENLFILSAEKEDIKTYHKKWGLRDSSWKALLERFFMDNW